MFLPVNITLQFGDTGDFVAELQRRLSMINLFNEAFINATFDSNTVNAVKSFQSMQGLRVDGVAGPETLRRLNGVISGDTSSTSGDKKEEEQTQQAAMLKTAALADFPITAPDPMLTAAAPAAEEKPVEKPVEQKAAIPAPPPRMDAQPDQQAQQQQQMDAQKQQALAQQQQQQQPDLQAQQQQQQMDAIKQQAEAQKAAAKPPEPKPEPKQEVQPEKKPLSAMLQKLVDYIESKLPRSVVDDVKAIGQNMLKAGVREAPEAGGAPSAPAIEAGRGQQQQQQAQR
jgi:peptidoglycan hydrolase-like protein with peptidoglycan-binding domain